MLGRDSRNCAFAACRHNLPERAFPHVTAGKHAEAIREGIQDHEYLVVLTDKIAAAKQTGNTGPFLDAAKQLLAEAADRVIAGQTPAKLNWTTPKDRSVADRIVCPASASIFSFSLICF